jgi:hypothetical protein
MTRYATDTMALVSYLGKRKMPPHVKQIFQLADVGLCEIIIPSVVFFEISYLPKKRELMFCHKMF